ncbi:MAG: anhydro-N-acetylmuramic acid kinase [Beijerinckiaceae bacterium]|nr:anhydro-N-acetylmuramic acid kinase [Beijerinckiaceae bacterium]
MHLYRAIGLMSGTSMDGIDVALVDTDGRALASPGPASFYPYDDTERALLRAAIAEALPLEDRTARPGKVGEAERLITTRHAEAVDAFISEHRLDRSTIAVVGFHGQTVLHRPQKRLTIQIGDGKALSTALGLPVAWDMRAADVAAGGQGAPLVPAWHRALVAAGRLRGPVLVINLGGVGNVTYVADGDVNPIAFDTGPANALIDDLMLERTGVAMDRDGRAAAAGAVNSAALKALLSHPYFSAPAPKSLDRNAFSRAAVARLSTEDAAATLAAFTAQTLALSLKLLPAQPRLAIVCGGGARNATLMSMVADALPFTVEAASARGLNGDAIEAQAFAYLAVRVLEGLPLTFPTTTGAPAPLTGGVVSHPG